MSESKKPRFMTRDSRPRMARDEDFAALFERELAARPSIPQDVPIERIRPNPFQARTTFEGIDELAQSMRVHGFTSRLRVRRDPTDPRFFQLVFGERRLRAAKAAGLAVVPCDIAEHTDEELIEIGLTENIQRQDLGPIEEAQAFRLLIDRQGYTHTRLAERIGKDRSYVEDRLVLLRAPEDVQALVAQRPDTLRAAREIAKVASPEERQPLIAGVMTGDLSQQAVRTLVREVIGRQGVTNGASSTSEPINSADQPPGHPEDTARTAPTTPSTASGFEQALQRDAHTLRVMCARWRQALPRLSPAERDGLVECIDQHLTELEQLSEALRE